jgi:hypothetical protein
VVDPPRTATTIETVLATIAIIAVGAFFVAVLPIWSGRRAARAVPLGK